MRYLESMEKLNRASIEGSMELIFWSSKSEVPERGPQMVAAPMLPSTGIPNGAVLGMLSKSH